MILSHAPLRLVKLDFKRTEACLKRDLKQADNDLKEEYAALETSTSKLDEISQRHDRIFLNGELMTRCESNLDLLRSYMRELIDDRTVNCHEVYSSLERHFAAIRASANEMNSRLKSLCKAWHFVDASLHELDMWLSEISLNSIGLFDSNLRSACEYKNSIERLTVCGEIFFLSNFELILLGNFKSLTYSFRNQRC